VTVNKINFTQPMPMAYYNRVRGIEGVRQVTHANWFGGYFQDPKNFLIVFAVEPSTYLDLYTREIEVPQETRATFVRERTSALVGAAMAEKWGWKVGDRVPISSNIFSQKTARKPGTSPSRGSHQQDAAVQHRFHDLPLRLFNETRCSARTHRLDRAADDGAGGQ